MAARRRSDLPRTARRVRSLGTRLAAARELVQRLEAVQQMKDLQDKLRAMRKRGLK